jgi:hypothetical protein
VDEDAVWRGLIQRRDVTNHRVDHGVRVFGLDRDARMTTRENSENLIGKPLTH